MADAPAASSSSSRSLSPSFLCPTAVFVTFVFVLCSSQSHSQEDPFSLTRAGLRDWLKKRLEEDFHRHADTLYEKELNGPGFKNETIERLEDRYGLSPGAAAQMIALRNTFLGGKRVFGFDFFAPN